MPIAFTNDSLLESSGFMRGLRCPTNSDQDRRFSPKKLTSEAISREKLEDGHRQVESSSSSSSIGRNSDLSERSPGSECEDSGEAEVQSSYKGSLNAMDSLEESLPMRRGISKFYCGKSKSFASLAEATTTCTKDLAKPENPYSRKRRNLLASSIICEDHHQTRHTRNKSYSNFKRLTKSSRSNSSSSDSSEDSDLLPPLYPSFNSLSSSRSFSFADLHNSSVDSHG